MKRNFIVIGVTLLVIVIVTVGVAVGMACSHASQDAAAKSFLKFSDVTDSLCAVTDHKKTCVDTLAQETEPASLPSPTDIIKTILSRLRRELQSVAAVTDAYALVALVPAQVAALQDCHDLLGSADDVLASSLLRAASAGFQFLMNQQDSLKSGLSAVISFQQTCKDGIKHPRLVKAMRLKLQTVTELTSDALALIAHLPEMNRILGAPAPPPVAGNHHNPRKLLQEAEAEAEAEAEEEEYPTWFSATERKLLQLQEEGLLKPNVVVAKDGSGHYTTISEALAASSEENEKRRRGTFVIYVKSGTYWENVALKSHRGRVFMYGDGPTKTVITGQKNYRDHFTALRTATFSVHGKGFIVRSMAFQNTAGPEAGQAVALQVQADMAAFFDCQIDGYEGTLHSLAHRQFYGNCVISGTVDFIFGDSSAVIQNSTIVVKKALEKQHNTITASRRADDQQTTGFVIHNSEIVADRNLGVAAATAYLGRACKRYSRTVIMESTLGDLIHPRGWLATSSNYNDNAMTFPQVVDTVVDTVVYREYGNKGAGATTGGRVHWRGFKVITSTTEALQYTVAPFIQGDKWLTRTGVPFLPALNL